MSRLGFGLVRQLSLANAVSRVARLGGGKAFLSSSPSSSLPQACRGSITTNSQQARQNSSSATCHSIALSRPTQSVCAKVFNRMPWGSSSTGVKAYSTLTKSMTKNPIVNGFSVRGMANHRHKKVLKLAKGFRGRSSKCYSVAYHRVQKARQYAYRDRKVKRREFRKLWIQRINAGTRMYGVTYSSFVNRMSHTGIALNRKVLADVAATEPLSFRAVLEVVESLGKKRARLAQP